MTSAGGDNREVVRLAYEAFNERGPNAFVEFLDPEVEWDESELSFGRTASVYRGREGVRKLLSENADLWNGIQIVVDEVIDAGEERVVAFIRASGRGRFTGERVELAVAEVWTMRDGLGSTVRLYLERAQALEEVGLSPG